MPGTDACAEPIRLSGKPLTDPSRSGLSKPSQGEIHQVVHDRHRADLRFASALPRPVSSASVRRLASASTVILLGLTAGAAQAGAPVGATAQCRDGTYSFSQHHSGTCSYHGGVAAWLTAGSATIAPSPPTTATSAAATSASASLVEVGKTVLLAARTETAGCKLGANPDRRCSPGAYYSKLTKTVICSPTFRTGPIRNVPVSEKFAVEQEYGIAPGHYGATLEIDHIVSLELGDRTTSPTSTPRKQMRTLATASRTSSRTGFTLWCARAR